MGSGRGAGHGYGIPLDFQNFSQKKVVFLVSSGKIKFHNFWPPLERFLKKTLVPPPGKNPPDSHLLH